ncbi:MAG: sortase [Anaerolineales bacterium]|nr:sortase [Anaerolineales bacterium]
MLRSRLHNLVIAFGIVLLLTGLSSSVTGLQQATTNFQLNSPLPVNISSEAEDSLSPGSSESAILDSQTDDFLPLNLDIENLDVHQSPNKSESITPGSTLSDHSKDEPQLIIPISPAIPERITIAAIELEAPVVQADMHWIQVGEVEYQQWEVPNLFAAGWHETSARLGEVGNTVFNGHNNIYGEVFRRLDELVVGELIQVYSNTHVFEYVITNTMILPERFQDMDVRMSNAQWILPSEDLRLTLISCWPYESNTHRVIVVAKLIAIEEQQEELDIEDLPTR